MPTESTANKHELIGQSLSNHFSKSKAAIQLPSNKYCRSAKKLPPECAYAPLGPLVFRSEWFSQGVFFGGIHDFIGLYFWIFGKSRHDRALGPTLKNGYFLGFTGVRMPNLWNPIFTEIFPKNKKHTYFYRSTLSRPSA